MLGGEALLLQLALRHNGQDPFDLYHYGDVAAAGRPAFPFRYKHFLMACAAVAHEQVAKESAMALGGTTSEAGQGRPAQGVRHKGKRKGR